MHRLAAAGRRAGRRITGLLPLSEPLPLMLPREARTRFTIGRDTGCDLVLGDRTVSRYHARLDRSGDGWLLGDLGSTNGTLLNGWRIAGQVAVRPGDRVSFGAMTFIVSDRT
jgi:pSer/pThr/pTyr-binding forkhead associated (FHA) protein